MNAGDPLPPPGDQEQPSRPSAHPGIDDPAAAAVEFEFFDYLEVLVKRRWVIFWGAVSCALALIFYLRIPAAYTATATLSPEDPVSTLNLGDPPQKGPPKSPGSSYSISVMEGVETTKEVLRKEYHYHRGEKDSVSQTLLEYFEAPTLSQAVDGLRGMVKFEADKIGAIKISVTTPYPELSALVANEYVSQLIVYYQEKRPTRINENLKVIAQRLAEVSAELSKAEAALVDFQKSNVNLIGGLGGNSPDLNLALSRLQREVAIKSGLFTTLTNQYESAKIEAAAQTPVIEVLGYADPKLCVRSSNRTLLTVSALGLLGSVFLAFFLEYIDRKRQAGRVDRLAEILREDRKRFRWFFRRPQG